VLTVMSRPTADKAEPMGEVPTNLRHASNVPARGKALQRPWCGVEISRACREAGDTSTRSAAILNVHGDGARADSVSDKRNWTPTSQST
jgi:hypothetical protein